MLWLQKVRNGNDRAGARTAIEDECSNTTHCVCFVSRYLVLNLIEVVMGAERSYIL